MEHPRFGENTFAPIYGILARIKVVEPPDWFQRGYNVPMWSNTATYLREIHADFGYIGLALFPYLLGLVTTFFWFKLYQNLSHYIFIAIKLSNGNYIIFNNNDDYSFGYMGYQFSYFNCYFPLL